MIDPQVPATRPPDEAPASLDVRGIYHSHGNFVWMTLQRMGVARADLEDMCQEVFVVVHRRLSSYNPDARLSAWLFGICIKVAGAYHRRAHRRHEEPRDFSQAPGIAADDARDPEQDALARQKRALLERMLDKLDLEHRAVFVMFEVEEIPCAEIARLCGIPVGTVYSRLHNARREVAKIAARARAREGKESAR